jgi:ribose transport system permease protein
VTSRKMSVPVSTLARPRPIVGHFCPQRPATDAKVNSGAPRMGNETADAGSPSFLGDVPGGTDVPLWRRLLSSQEFWVTVAVFALGVAVTFVTSRFATLTNLGNVLQNFCYIGLMAIGMTPILITGGIDISVGSILGLCGVVLGLLLQAGWPLWAALVATLTLGAALGGFNGALIAYLRLPPFLVTLGMLSVARSMALVVSDGQVVYNFGGSENALFAIGGKLFGVPSVLYATLFAALILQILLSMTRWGRYIFAVGGNARAARLTGIPVKRLKVSAYAFGGLMAAVTSVFLVAWLGSVTNALGQGDELRVIAGTVIGGASLAGGYGTAYGAVIGSLLIEELRNALLLAGVNPFWQGTFIGSVIVLAIILQRIQVTEEED